MCCICGVPHRLRRLHHADFTEDFARGLEELLRAFPPRLGRNKLPISDLRCEGRSNDLDPTYVSTLVTEHAPADMERPCGTRSEGDVSRAPHRPPPVIETPSGNSYASMNLAGIIIARVARAGGASFPDDVMQQISGSPGLRVDQNSISRDGRDVVFHAWLKQDDGSEKSVWTRVGTTPRNLEEKLLGDN